jgi:hypothetical protein
MCTMTFPHFSNLKIHVRVKKGENLWYAPCVLSVLSPSLDQLTCEEIARAHKVLSRNPTVAFRVRSNLSRQLIYKYI